MFRLKTNLVNKELNLSKVCTNERKKSEKLKVESVSRGETDRSSLFTLTEMWEV